MTSNKINSDSNNNTNEVSIIDIFNYFGKAFSKVRQNLRSILCRLYTFGIWLVVYLLKYKFIFLIVVVFGAIIGTFLDRRSDFSMVYKNQIVVTPNFNSVYYLYGKVQEYNNAVGLKNYDFLSKELSISNDKAQKIIGFNVEPVINSADIVEQYWKIIDNKTSRMMRDTFRKNEYTYSDFLKTVTPYSYKTHKLYVYASNAQITTDVTNNIITSIANNPDLLQKQQIAIHNIYRTDSIYHNALQKVHDLQQAYNTALTEKSKDRDNDNFVNISSHNVTPKDIDISSTPNPKNRELEAIEMQNQIGAKINENQQLIVDNSTVMYILSKSTQPIVVVDKKEYGDLAGIKSLLTFNQKMGIILSFVIFLGILFFIKILNFIKREKKRLHV